MKLTKRQALEITRDMWAWLASNPSKGKQDYIAIRPEIDGIKWGCACCQYARGRAGVVCENCPLLGLWNEYVIGTELPCAQDGGLFKMWEYTDCLYEKADHAKTISDAAIAALAELDAVEAELTKRGINLNAPTSEEAMKFPRGRF